MRKQPPCFGEHFAFQAGIEAPTCWVCDYPITDTKDMGHTTRGEPLCRACTEEIEQRIQARLAGVPVALPAIINHGRHYVDL